MNTGGVDESSSAPPGDILICCKIDCLLQWCIQWHDIGQVAEGLKKSKCDGNALLSPHGYGKNILDMKVYVHTDNGSIDMSEYGYGGFVTRVNNFLNCDRQFLK